VVDAGALLLLEPGLLLLEPGLLLLEPGLDVRHSLITIVLQSASDVHSPALVDTAATTKFLQNGTLLTDIWQ
jgi:hypothetical protein